MSRTEQYSLRRLSNQTLQGEIMEQFVKQVHGQSKSTSLMQVGWGIRFCLSLVTAILFWGIGLGGAQPQIVRAEPRVGEAVTGNTVNGDPQSTIPANLTGCGGVQVSTANAEFEEKILQLTNDIRHANGLLPFKRVSFLDDAAHFHATDMGLDDYFSHTSHDRVNGQLVESCRWNDRVKLYYPSWAAIAENIAAGYQTPETVVQGWMNSPGHRANILNANNWEIGIGYYTGSGNYRHYWVQDFGRRYDVYPLILNRDIGSTTSGDLTVNLYGEWQDVRFRTDNGIWSGWQPFQTSMTWRLLGTVGLHTVHVEMRKDGEIFSSSDTIHLAQNTLPVELASMPSTLNFFYIEDEQRLSPDMHVLYPLSDAPAGHVWRTLVDGNWLNVSPSEGGVAQQTEIRPVVNSANTVSPSTAKLMFLLYDDNGNVVDSHSVDVSMQSVSNLSNQIFLPAITRTSR